MREDILKAIKKHRIIAILRGVDDSDLIKTAEALYDGGIRLIEVAYNQSADDCIEDTIHSIYALQSRFGNDVLLGAGTVLTTVQTAAAADAGADYIISPNTDPAVIAKTRELGLVSIPGAMTPSEITAAYEAGADIVKLFPADALGLRYLKAIRSPLSHIPLMAVGGVNLDNLASFMSAGLVGVGLGSNIVNRQLIREGNFAAVRDLAKSYCDLMASL